MPTGLVLADPVTSRIEAAGSGGHHAVATLLVGDHQTRIYQVVHVLKDGGEAHVEGFGELAYARRPLSESRKHRAPARVGERREGAIQLVKHGLKYCARVGNSQVITSVSVTERR